MSIIMSIGVAICMIDNMVAITIGRFTIGLGAGGFCSYSPAYISEMSPTEMSGTLGAVSQFFVTFGIAFPSWLSLLFPRKPAEDPDSFWVQSFWRYFWATPWLFAIIQCTLLLTVYNYDSPVELKSRKQYQKLRELMNKMYDESVVEARIKQIKTIESA